MLMLYSRRTWTAIAVLLIAWLLPTRGFCFQADPYGYKSLTGLVLFQFDRETNEYSSYNNDENTFTQKYSLLFTGYAINRRLVILDLGYDYTNEDFRSSNNSRNTGRSTYNASATFLPLSSIPLTLYARRRASRYTSTTERHSVDSTYGFKWYLYLRTLPITKMRVERHTLDFSDGPSVVTDTYRLDLEKTLGPTKNSLSYDMVNSTRPEPGSSRYTLTFANTTDISKNTHFFLGASRSSGDSALEASTSYTGLSLSLTSNPSRDFTQTHSYNYYKIRTEDNVQTASIYGGDMSYDFTDNLDAAFSLHVDDVTNESPTFGSSSVALGTSMNIGYKLGRRFRLSQLVSYESVQTNSNDPASNLSDIERLRTLSSIRYNQSINWAFLTASAGVGYTDEQSGNREAGQAIEQKYNLGLTKINLSEYVGADTTLSYTTRKTISGNDIGSSSYDYMLKMYNKVWKEYVKSTASFTKSKNTSYLDDFSYGRELYRLDGESAYFMKTKINAFAERQLQYDKFSGDSTSTSLGFSVSHDRVLLKGQLHLSFSYNTVDKAYSAGYDKIDSTRYGLKYNRQIIRNMGWSLIADRSTQQTRNSYANLTSIKNIVTYPLRSWTLSGDYEYRIIDQTSYQRTQTILMLRATRGFSRVW